MAKLKTFQLYNIRSHIESSRKRNKSNKQLNYYLSYKNLEVHSHQTNMPFYLTPHLFKNILYDIEMYICI